MKERSARAALGIERRRAALRRPDRACRGIRRAVAGCAIVGVATALGGCRPELRPAVEPSVAVEQIAHAPRLGDDGDAATLAAAVRASVAYYERLPAEQTFTLGAERFTAARMRDALSSLAHVLEGAPPPDAIADEVERRFVTYRATAPDGVLFTGYYLPALAARPHPDARFRHPVFGRPNDLVSVPTKELPPGCPAEIVGRIEGQRMRPYFTRAEIAAGALHDAPVLGWVDDPVALFFLHVQGSGTLVFPDGPRAIGFAGSNGHPYVSIGKMLIEEGSLSADAASMQGIRRWLAEHPGEEARVLNANPRFVFFRRLEGSPVGSLGVPVTAGRSIATDPSIYPPGALAYVNVPPSDGPPVTRALTRWMVNQDRGAAIRGPARVDVFFGAGAAAEETAGRMKTRGELYLFAPR